MTSHSRIPKSPAIISYISKCIFLLRGLIHVDSLFLSVPPKKLWTWQKKKSSPWWHALMNLTVRQARTVASSGFGERWTVNSAQGANQWAFQKMWVQFYFRAKLHLQTSQGLRKKHKPKTLVLPWDTNILDLTQKNKCT